jgi:hypothetical protein
MIRPLYIAYRVAEMAVSLLSRFINAALLGGSTHQTTSARAYIEPMPRLRVVINAIFFWQENHCRWAWENEVTEAKRTLARAKVSTEG